MAILYDNAASGFQPGTTTSITYELIVGNNANRLLVCGVMVETTTGFTVTSITYDGVGFTKIDHLETDEVGRADRAELWYLLNPNVGTANIVVTISAAKPQIASGTISVYGVKQQAAEATAKQLAKTANFVTTNITPLTDNAWVIDACGCGQPETFTPGGGQTERYDQTDSSSSIAGSTKPVATAGLTSLTQTPTGIPVNRLLHLLAAFAPEISTGSDALPCGFNIRRSTSENLPCGFLSGQPSIDLHAGFAVDQWFIDPNDMRRVKRETIIKRTFPMFLTPGDTIFVDDWERASTLPWNYWPDDGGSIAINSTKFLHGEKSVQVNAGSLDHGVCMFAIGLLKEAVYSMELWFHCDELEANWKKMQYMCEWRNGTDRYEVGIMYEVQPDGAPSHKWYYQSGVDPQTWTLISPTPMYIEAGDSNAEVWNHIRLVFDMKAKTYCKLQCNEVEYDISGKVIPASPYGDATFPRIQLNLEMFSDLRFDHFGFNDEGDSDSANLACGFTVLQDWKDLPAGFNVKYGKASLKGNLYVPYPSETLKAGFNVARDSKDLSGGFIVLQGWDNLPAGFAVLHAIADVTSTTWIDAETVKSSEPVAAVTSLFEFSGTLQTFRRLKSGFYIGYYKWDNVKSRFYVNFTVPRDLFAGFTVRQKTENLPGAFFVFQAYERPLITLDDFEHTGIDLEELSDTLSSTTWLDEATIKSSEPTATITSLFEFSGTLQTFRQLSAGFFVGATASRSLHSSLTVRQPASAALKSGFHIRQQDQDLRSAFFVFQGYERPLITLDDFEHTGIDLEELSDTLTSTTWLDEATIKSSEPMATITSLFEFSGTLQTFRQLSAGFFAGASASRDLKTGFTARQPASNNLSAGFFIRIGEHDLHAGFTVFQSYEHPSISIEDFSKTGLDASDMADITSFFELSSPGYLGTYAPLSAGFTVRYGIGNIKAGFFRGADASRDLAAGMIIRRSSSKDAPSEFIVRGSSIIDLSAGFFRGTCVDRNLNAGFDVKQSNSQNLFAKSIIVHASTLVTGTTGLLTDKIYQRKTFYAKGLHWAFYNDTGTIVYKTSSDGYNWSIPIDVFAHHISDGFSLFYDGIYIHWAGAENLYNTAIFYQRGIPNSDGSITWSTPGRQTAVPASATKRYNYPIITVDSNGYPWIGWREQNPSGWFPYVIKSDNNNGTWSGSETPFQLDANSSSLWHLQLVHLLEGRIYVILNQGSTINTRGRLWDGSWNSWEDLGLKTSGAGYLSAVSKAGDIYLAFTKNNQNLTFIRRTWGVGWGLEYLIYDPPSQAPPIALSKAAVDGHLYVFFQPTTNSPIAQHVFYCNSEDYGETWTSPVDIIDESENGFFGITSLNIAYEQGGDVIGFEYTRIYAPNWQARYSHINDLTQVASGNLSAGFDVNQTNASRNLKAGFRTSALADASQLPAGFGIRQVGVALLPGEFALRRPGVVVLPAGFKVVLSSSHDILGRIVVRGVAIRDLHGQLSLRREGSASLSSAILVKQIGTNNLPSGFVIIRAATRSLSSKLLPIRSASRVLRGVFVSQPVRDLRAKFFVNFQTIELPAVFYVRPSQSLLTDFIIKDTRRGLTVRDTTRELTVHSTRRKMKVR